MNLTTMGSGYVGLVTGACMAELGKHVVCVDNDADQIERLNKGDVPICEPGLEDGIERNCTAGRLEFTTDIEHVRIGTGSDPRVGYHFIIYPGVGYGGSCFPRDGRAFIQSRRSQ